MAASTSSRLSCQINELKLDKTLASGQCFRWKEITTGVWRGVIDDDVWTLWQTDSELFYDVSTKIEYRDTKIKTELDSSKIEHDSSTVFQDKTMDKKSIKIEPSKAKTASLPENFSVQWTDCPTDRKRIKLEPKGDNSVVQGILDSDKEKFFDKIRNYFRLDVSLSELYEKWSSADDNFKKVSQNFRGIRILRQDPVEILFSFICSSNNNISRISSMVEKLCENYGDFICKVDDQAYYSFPSVSRLAEEGVEENLRTLGFGYRAKFIYKSAKYIQENCTESWLYDLRNKPYNEIKKELMNLRGVGDKVADCVCLMSMDKLEVVPVDTHVKQIAARDYMPWLKEIKSLTEKRYNEIGDYFRKLWGDKAGWAQQIKDGEDIKKDSKSPQKKTTERKK